VRYREGSATATLSRGADMTARRNRRTDKAPFDIDRAMRDTREAVRPYPQAAMFELAELGHRTVFELLVGCIISIRTRDETTLPVARGLLARAGAPAEMVRLKPKEIDQLIAACTFHEAKAQTIHAIARHAVEKFGGVLPCDAAALLALRGVGPKCAHLVLGIACGQPYISVDIHVHRVTNRWGYVQAPTPEKTMTALEAKLPQRYWVEINALLVPFGKHVCTGQLPKCSTCPLLEMCQQVGVFRHQ
jgi:endonuclease-3